MYHYFILPSLQILTFCLTEILGNVIKIPAIRSAFHFSSCVQEDSA